MHVDERATISVRMSSPSPYSPLTDPLAPEPVDFASPPSPLLALASHPLMILPHFIILQRGRGRARCQKMELTPRLEWSIIIGWEEAIRRDEVAGVGG